MKICTYREGIKADFYIQSKGEHAGRPLKQPIANCFAITCKRPHAYQIAYCLFKSKIYYPYIGGTVIPFMSLYDFKQIFIEQIHKKFDDDKLDKLDKIDKLIQIEKERLKLYTELQITVSQDILKNAK